MEKRNATHTMIEKFTNYLGAAYSLGLSIKTVTLIKSQVAWLIKHSQCRSLVEFCRKETIEGLIEELSKKQIGHRIITTRTVQNYLLSLEHFITFLLQYSKIFISISRKRLTIFQGDVRKMTKAIGRKARKLIWERLQTERLAKQTSTQIKQYRRSSLRQGMIAKIKNLTPVTARRYNPTQYVELLGFLGLEISLENANRPGELMNMKVEDYENRIRNRSEIRLIEILQHKTLLSQGPAYISVTKELDSLLGQYFNIVRPTIVRNDSPNLFFLNSVGSQVHQGSFTNYINKIWTICYPNRKFTNTLLRKTAVAQVHKYKNHYQAQLSSRMNHRAETAARSYFLDDKIATCFRMGTELKTILEESETSNLSLNLVSPSQQNPDGKGRWYLI